MHNMFVSYIRLRSGGLLGISILIESHFERHLKHDTINNCLYNLTLKYIRGTYIALINRSAEKLYDFARLVLDFKSLSKANSIRIEIENIPPVFSTFVYLR